MTKAQRADVLRSEAPERTICDDQMRIGKARPQIVMTGGCVRVPAASFTARATGNSSAQVRPASRVVAPAASLSSNS